MQSKANDLYEYVALLFQYGARMAHTSLRFVKAIWLTSTITLIGGVCYLQWRLDAHWLWSASYGIIALLPIIVLTFYHWMLTSLTQAPEQLESLRDTLNRFQTDHPEETKQVLKHKFSSLGRWSTYRLIGKVVKDIISGTGDATALAGQAKTLTAMANPFFWLILIISLILSFLFSSCMIVILSLLMFFT